MALDEFAEFVAVIIFHVDEFDATTAVGADVSNNRSEIDFAQA
jgi:hypothetical protein